MAAIVSITVSAMAPATLYTITLSHPGEASRLALVQADIEHRVVEVPGGTHVPLVKALGFERHTVPALKLADGARVQGTLDIARWIDAQNPGCGLYPSDAEARAKVEAAERWGESQLQPLPRRFIRWAMTHHQRIRRWFADTATPFPLPGLTGASLAPIAPIFLRLTGGSDEVVQSDLAALPGRLDEVRRLLSEGILGGKIPNAADLQIATTLVLLASFEDLAPLFDDELVAYYRRVAPKPAPMIPPALPAAWTPAV